MASKFEIGKYYRLCSGPYNGKGSRITGLIWRVSGSKNFGMDATGDLLYIPTRPVEENEDWSSTSPEFYDEISEEEVSVYIMANRG